MTNIKPIPPRDSEGPKLDRLVFHCLLGGEKPLAATPAEWDYYFAQNKVFQYKLTPISTGGERHDSEVVNSLPFPVSQHSKGYVMIRIPGDHRCVDKMKSKKDSGKLLDKGLSGRYQLTRENDYFVHQVYLNSQEPWRDPPEEYMVVMKKSAYQALAMNMLANLTLPEVENYLILGAAGKHAKYVDKDSDQRKVIEKIVANADLTEGQVQLVIKIACEKANYELAAALQNIVRERASYAEQVKQSRLRPPGGAARSGS